ncbi:hepatoma-derived growth factor-related protein 2 isoform X2 [Gadus macrocephalus]|nr:hepatoma-derived growth factor-related protein 2 isoform X2 [Gadus macrocephalus]
MAEAPLHPAKKRLEPESLDESSIERASILDRLPHGTSDYPLHSTALEEDLRLPEDEEEEVSRPAEKVEKKVGGRAGGPGKAAPSAGAKQRPAASPRSQEPGDRRARKRKSVGEKEAAGRGGKPARKKAGGITEEERRKGPGLGRGPGPRPARGSRPPPRAPAPREASPRVTAPDRQTTAKRVSRQLQLTFVARPGKVAGAEEEEEKKKGGKLVNRKSSSSETPTPDPKRARTRKSSSGQSADRQRHLARTSSPGRSGAEPTVSQTDRPGERSRGPAGADASVVLQSFLSLCQTYKESVESTAVRRAIDSLSSSLEGRLTERITASKELRVLKRDNGKVNSQIKAKTQKLLDAKYERFRAEQQLGSLRKEKVELRQRLAHVRRGFSFLQGLGDLTTRYLAHRRAHPSEKEQEKSGNPFPLYPTWEEHYPTRLGPTWTFTGSRRDLNVDCRWRSRRRSLFRRSREWLDHQIGRAVWVVQSACPAGRDQEPPESRGPPPRQQQAAGGRDERMMQ